MNSELRLVGPSGPQEGTSSGVVEILHAGRWGIVCSSTFGQKEASVVCRQLGFMSGTFTNNALIPNLNPQTWLTEVNCHSGLETRLDLCQHGPWFGECDDPFNVAYVTCGMHYSL